MQAERPSHIPQELFPEFFIQAQIVKAVTGPCLLISLLQRLSRVRPLSRPLIQFSVVLFPRKEEDTSAHCVYGQGNIEIGRPLPILLQALPKFVGLLRSHIQHAESLAFHMPDPAALPARLCLPAELIALPAVAVRLEEPQGKVLLPGFLSGLSCPLLPSGGISAVLQPGLDLNVERHLLQTGGQPGQIVLLLLIFPVFHRDLQMLQPSGNFRPSGIPFLPYQPRKLGQLLSHIGLDADVFALAGIRIPCRFPVPRRLRPLRGLPVSCLPRLHHARLQQQRFQPQMSVRHAVILIIDVPFSQVLRQPQIIVRVRDQPRHITGIVPPKLLPEVTAFLLVLPRHIP